MTGLRLLLHQRLNKGKPARSRVCFNTCFSVIYVLSIVVPSTVELFAYLEAHCWNVTQQDFAPNVTEAQIKDPVKLGMGLAATGIGFQIEAA